MAVVWEKGLKELVANMTNRDHSKVPSLFDVYQELSRLLELNSARNKLREFVRQILPPAHQEVPSPRPHLKAIHTEQGVRVARRLPFSLTAPRPLRTCQRLCQKA